MKSLLQFMQSQDKNGLWLEWLEEIENEESSFDADYVLTILTKWYNNSNESKYLRWIEHVSTI